MELDGLVNITSGNCSNIKYYPPIIKTALVTSNYPRDLKGCTKVKESQVQGEFILLCASNVLLRGTTQQDKIQYSEPVKINEVPSQNNLDVSRCYDLTFVRESTYVVVACSSSDKKLVLLLFSLQNNSDLDTTTQIMFKNFVQLELTNDKYLQNFEDMVLDSFDLILPEVMTSTVLIRSKTISDEFLGYTVKIGSDVNFQKESFKLTQTSKISNYPTGIIKIINTANLSFLLTKTAYFKNPKQTTFKVVACAIGLTGFENCSDGLTLIQNIELVSEIHMDVSPSLLGDGGSLVDLVLTSDELLVKA